MTLLALVVAVTAGAQVMDTTLTGNTVNINLNLSKLDSTIGAMQALIEAQQATIESLQESAFDGDYNSLTNQPAIPSNVSDLTNDAGFTTVSQADSIAVGVAWRGELSGADLAEAHLYDANLSGADLAGADLAEANLYDANLYVADLSGADLSDANLYDAYLAEANLSGADLSGANLYDAVLTGANLTGVTWTGAYIENCIGCPCTDANNDNYCD